MDDGWHAVVSALVGGSVARHNAVRDALAVWLREVGVVAQHMPRWDREGESAISWVAAAP